MGISQKTIFSDLPAVFILVLLINNVWLVRVNKSIYDAMITLKKKKNRFFFCIDASLNVIKCQQMFLNVLKRQQGSTICITSGIKINHSNLNLILDQVILKPIHTQNNLRRSIATVWFQIIKKMVSTILFRFDLLRFFCVYMIPKKRFQMYTLAMNLHKLL